MLAVLCRRCPATTSGWAYEIKWDGVRAIAYCEAATCASRAARCATSPRSYPELRALGGRARLDGAVLDGEVVASTSRAAQLRAPPGPHAPARERPIRRRDGRLPGRLHDLRPPLAGRRKTDGQPYTERRERLEGLGLDGPELADARATTAATARVSSTPSASGPGGLVAKRLDSRYHPGIAAARG